jgi:hypothetical protein
MVHSKTPADTTRWKIVEFFDAAAPVKDLLEKMGSPASTATVTRIRPIRGKKYEAGTDEIRRTAVYTTLKLVAALALRFGVTMIVSVLANDTFGRRKVTKKSNGSVWLASTALAKEKDELRELRKENDVVAASIGSVTLVIRMRTVDLLRGTLGTEMDTNDGRNGGCT